VILVDEEISAGYLRQYLVPQVVEIERGRRIRVVAPTAPLADNWVAILRR
jgi:hypothetical protein